MGTLGPNSPFSACIHILSIIIYKHQNRVLFALNCNKYVCVHSQYVCKHKRNAILFSCVHLSVTYTIHAVKDVNSMFNTKIP